MGQFSLFDDLPTQFSARRRADTTFHGKLIEPVHRWFRLTPSFSPQLARDVLDRLAVRPGQRVLEPYCGTGTVPLEARRRGNDTVAMEINPALHFVARVKTAVYAIEAARSDLLVFRARWLEEMRCITTPQAYLAAHPHLVPRIAYPERWWAPGTRSQIATARHVLAQPHSYAYPDLVRFAIGSIVIEVSAAKHNHPSMSFADGPAAEKDALAAFDRRCEQILHDVALERAGAARATIYHGNTREIATTLAAEEPFDALITSPPYPNRFSYARETRPLLFFLDLVRDAGEVGDLEIAAMGGTWGRATWVLQQPVSPANDLLTELLSPFIREAKGVNPILVHYVIRYFNDLWEHARGISAVMAPHATMAWVVGNARMGTSEVPTADHLAAILRAFGWSCDEIIHMRKRHSKRGLLESIVFLSR